MYKKNYSSKKTVYLKDGTTAKITIGDTFTVTGKVGFSRNMDFHFRRTAGSRPGHFPTEGVPAEQFVSFRPAFYAGSQSKVHMRLPAGAATAVSGMKAGAA